MLKKIIIVSTVDYSSLLFFYGKNAVSNLFGAQALRLSLFYQEKYNFLNFELKNSQDFKILQ